MQPAHVEPVAGDFVGVKYLYFIFTLLMHGSGV
jgi:hypothetical protein